MKNSIKSDEQSQLSPKYSQINWVGMSKIQSYINDGDQNVSAEVNVFVNLLSGYRGIHMSRLYALQSKEILGQKIAINKLNHFIDLAIQSQEGISNQAKIEIKYNTFLKTKSLKSESDGFRSYPVVVCVEGREKKEKKITIQFEVIYSSTCPQSAKLSKEFFKNTIQNQNELIKWYESDLIYPATPHAQRSKMTIQLMIDPNYEIDIKDWIVKIENCLKTNVQTSVKKADEMEFAHLNAENTMFCEDAARRVAHFLDLILSIKGYDISVSHEESLHPHNASCQIIKNMPL